MLYNTLIAYLKSLGKEVIATASTGVASILLHEGRTAHSAFKVSIDVDKNSLPTIDPDSVLAKRIVKADVLIIDEISMLNKEVLHFIDRQVCDLCLDARDQPFGGKTVLISGDFKQLTPVVIGGGRGG
jgi:ATP-dependent DNA helicase PIF1